MTSSRRRFLAASCVALGPARFLPRARPPLPGTGANVTEPADGGQPAAVAPDALGRLVMEPSGPVVAGSFETLRFTYSAGPWGMMEGRGAVKLAFREPCDWGMPQLDHPAEPNYTTVRTTGKGSLRVRLDPAGLPRPFGSVLHVTVLDEPLQPDDQIVITLGDRSAGSPGLRVQSFEEERCWFGFFVDLFGPGRFEPLPSPGVTVVGGEPTRLVVVATSLVRPNEAAWVLVKAEDPFGNTSPSFEGRVRLTSDPDGVRLPDAVVPFRRGELAVRRIEGVSFAAPGVYRLAAHDEAGRLRSTSNPIVCSASREHALLWGDLHGGQGESSGSCGTLPQFYRYARDCAPLDFVSFQPNDYCLATASYQESVAVTRSFHQPGRFVPFQGWEWSGTTARGGDHNVVFKADDGPLHRCSHWAVDDKSDSGSDVDHVTKLYGVFRGRDDVLLMPHVGGRFARLDEHDAHLEPLIEVCSWHGVHEWFLEEALRRGLRVGFAAGADGVRGHPGGTTPGFSSHRQKSGLTGVYARELSREGLWEAFKARRTFATTGARIVLDVEVAGQPMGAAVRTGEPPAIKGRVMGAGPLDWIDVMRDVEVIHHIPIATVAPPNRLRIVFEGQRVRGWGREAVWNGGLRVDGSRIVGWGVAGFRFGLDRLVQEDERSLRWIASTVGDRKAVDLELERADASISLEAGHVRQSLTVTEITGASQTFAGGGLNDRVVVGPGYDPGPRDATFEIQDTQATPGIHAYYVRVTQLDTERAWSSPVYVEYAPR
jgi:hypothetical protein